VVGAKYTWFDNINFNEGNDGAGKNIKVAGTKMGENYF
jgi:hypothetical protein